MTSIDYLSVRPSVCMCDVLCIYVCISSSKSDMRICSLSAYYFSQHFYKKIYKITNCMLLKMAWRAGNPVAKRWRKAAGNYQLPKRLANRWSGIDKETQPKYNQRQLNFKITWMLLSCYGLKSEFEVNQRECYGLNAFNALVKIYGYTLVYHRRVWHGMRWGVQWEESGNAEPEIWDSSPDIPSSTFCPP